MKTITIGNKEYEIVNESNDGIEINFDLKDDGIDVEELHNAFTWNDTFMVDGEEYTGYTVVRYISKIYDIGVVGICLKNTEE